MLFRSGGLDGGGRGGDGRGFGLGRSGAETSLRVEGRGGT